MTRKLWQLAPYAVAAGRDITGTVITGPTYVQVVAGSFDRLHDAIFDPVELSEQLDLAHFCGREKLIERIDSQIATQSRGYVVIRGEAGVGKSSLAAHLVWTRPWAFHFTRLGGGARNPAEARKSLAAQLIGGWGLADRFAPGDLFPAAADRPDWLAKVIRAAAAERDRRAPGHPLVLVVDGLDEAEPDPPGMATGVPLGLPVPDALPVGVYIVATSRYGLPLVALQDPQRVGWSQISVEGEDNLADMRRYLRAAVSGPKADPGLVTALRRNQIESDRFVDTLMDKCRGVWIYLRYVLDDIRAGLRPPTEVAGLPDRLRGYYLLQISRWAADQQIWRQLYRPALASLAALQRPVTADDLAHIHAFHADSGTGSAEQIAAWLDGPARPFLDVIRTTERRRAYSLRHQSLRDLFVAAPSDPDDEDPADAGISEHLHTSWITAQHAIIRWLTPTTADGRRDWASADDYTRLMLPSHAALAGALDSLMSDPGFLVTCSPSEILRHRHRLRSIEGNIAARVLEAATNQWINRPDDDPRWWLHVWARRLRAAALAGALVADAPEWPWIIKTAFWSGTTHRVFTGHIGGVWAVAALPQHDGHALIISGGVDKTVRLWDPNTGTQIGPTITGHTGRVLSVAALPHPDGNALIISGSDDRTVRVWEPNTGKQIGPTITGHSGRVLSVSALPRREGQPLVISGGEDTTVRVWDPNTGKQVGPTITGHTGQVLSVAALPHPGGNALIISGSDDETVRVWDPNTGKQVGPTITGHTGRVLSVAALPHPGGNALIISGSDDETVRVWDPNTGKQIGPTITGHTDEVLSVEALSQHDGHPLIISGSEDRTVGIWDSTTDEQTCSSFTGHTNGVLSVAALPQRDGNALIISGSDDSTVRLWDPSTRKQLGPTLAGHTHEVFSVAALPQGDGNALIISGSLEGAIRVWDPRAGTPRDRRFAGNRRRTWSVAALPRRDQPALIISGDDETVLVWDPDTGDQTCPPLEGHIHTVRSVAALPRADGRALIISGGDETVRVWDPDTGRQIGPTLTGHTGGVLSVAALPRRGGNALIISGSFDRTIRVWDPDTGKQIGQTRVRHEIGVRSLAALPQPGGNALIISGSFDRTIRVWDPDTGKQVGHTLVGHAGAVLSVAALPQSDGHPLIISGSDDQTVRVWDLGTGKQVGQTLAGHTGAVLSVATLPQSEGHPLIISGSSDRSILTWVPATRF